MLRLLGTPLRLKDKKLSVELDGAFKLIQDATAIGITTNKKYATLETRINSGHSAEEQALIKNGGGDEELPLVSKSLRE